LLSFDSLSQRQASIGVVGLGYVGLPLASLLATKFKIIGFDIDSRRINELRDGIDRTREVFDREALMNKNLSYTDDASELAKCGLIIVAVPTPVDRFNTPDMHPLESATMSVAKNLSPQTVVVYESTVYPGVTEDFCGELLAKKTGFKLNKDFYLGYSPERINPGDKQNTIASITKIVSGSNPEVAKLLEQVYGSVIRSGIHVAPSIRAAEAAKVIENTQRDVNIAIVNEFSKIFDRMGIDTLEVLEAAGTKWNFLPFRPGLVGGHCIGVDPYYLTHAAEGLGYYPEVILAARRINDDMPNHIASKAIELVLNQPVNLRKGKIKVGILGVTFKEDIPDVRNTKVVDLARRLQSLGAEVYLCDPEADSIDFQHEYGLNLQKFDSFPLCDAIIVAVKHKQFLGMDIDELCGKLNPDSRVILDIKGMLDRKKVEGRNINLWRM
jgi:UDP-N-acetyl-D-galactosamine dehydrogenase